MTKNNNIRISKLHICSFDKASGDLLKLNLSKYPERLCVVDEDNEIVIDVESRHQYPYVRVISMMYILSEMDRKKIQFGKRVGCIEYATLPFSEFDSKTINECIEIINLLKQGIKFLDGNEELTNEEYLEMINNTKNNKKVKKKRK